MRPRSSVADSRPCAGGDAMPRAGGELVVRPDPVREGQDVEVTYSGEGTLYYATDRGDWKPVPLDPKTGKGKVMAPLGAKVLVFSNRRWPRPTEALVEVFSSA